MFKGLAGLKKVVKGGLNVVAEHSSQLAEQVVSDPSTSKDNLKETLKKKVTSVIDAGGVVINSDNSAQVKDKASEVVHKVKHYGAFGEEYLGYADPTKELRKAVKQKEKAAKKARKDKKKKTGKKEDLFDPANFEKYKREIEQKRLEKEAALRKADDPEHEDTSDKSEVCAELASAADRDDDSDDQDKEQGEELNLDFTQAEPERSAAATPLRSPPHHTPDKEQSEDWKLFQQLTSGVDLLVQKKKLELEDLKQESYFQKKATQPLRSGAHGRSSSKKKWVDLDQAGFEDFDGAISGDDPDADQSLTEHRGTKEGQLPTDAKQDEDPATHTPDIGLVEVPEDDPVDLDAEEDIFNTDFVDAITSGEIKLAVIPDDPIFDPKDDPFNTGFAEHIVLKDNEAKRRQASRIKFSGLSSVADVLSGKSDKVEAGAVEHSVKQKRRRANRINLIAEQEHEVTSRDQIGTCDPDAVLEQADLLANEGLGPAEVTLSITPSPTPVPAPSERAGSKASPIVAASGYDLKEFESLTDGKAECSLTSNIAILVGEFATPALEEDDDFDAAFDALAHESVTKSKLEDLERQFADEDVFDTSTADQVLNLVSLANQVTQQEEPLDDFEDKDPFDTSAFDDIADELQEELDFESLSKRQVQPDDADPEDRPALVSEDVFGASATRVGDATWEAFREKPARPPPPKSRRAPGAGNNLSATGPRPSVVVKAPSTESIKSWNISVAETLIRKSAEQDSLDLDQALKEDEEFDPFDTTGFDRDDPAEEEEIDIPINIDDPFDTSAVKQLLEQPDSDEEEERVPSVIELQSLDLLSTAPDLEAADHSLTIQPVKEVEVDPFDTDFASKVLPNKGDPFDTSFVRGGPGRAELQALVEQFVEKDEFDPRTEEGGTSKPLAPGSAGRARPKRSCTGPLQVRAPIPDQVVPLHPDKEEHAKKVKVEEVLDDEDDPFDTSIVDQVVPVRRAHQRPELSVEDQDFDPASSFASTITKEELDPFDTSPYEAAGTNPQANEPTPPEETPAPADGVHTPEPTSELHPEQPEGGLLALKPPRRRTSARSPVLVRQITDEDFDPRA